MKYFVVPIIIGAMGILNKGLKNLETFNRFSTSAVLGTSHIMRAVLRSETWSLSGGVHLWFKGRNTRGKGTCDKTWWWWWWWWWWWYLGTTL